ncbi:DAK2 domain-containing protein, partial [Candidatus Poribacteria bacterium]
MPSSMNTNPCPPESTTPVEGTILTVIREAAEEAAQCASGCDDIAELLETTLNRAKTALENTPNLLPRLA